MKNIAIFPGSFDPFTIGHYQLVQRALPLFSKIVVAIGQNSSKHPLFSIEQRVEKIQQLFANEPKIEVATYHTLTVDFAKSIDANFILRGIRSTIDYEYERNIAQANKALTGIETIFLNSNPEVSHISSSLVRELASYGKDITPYLP